MIFSCFLLFWIIEKSDGNYIFFHLDWGLTHLHLQIANVWGRKHLSFNGKFCLYFCFLLRKFNKTNLKFNNSKILQLEITIFTAFITAKLNAIVSSEGWSDKQRCMQEQFIDMILSRKHHSAPSCNSVLSLATSNSKVIAENTERKWGQWKKREIYINWDSHNARLYSHFKAWISTKDLSIQKSL